jgi:hypothetical protein
MKEHFYYTVSMGLYHTVAIFVETMGLKSPGFPCPLFEVYQSIPNNGFHSHVKNMEAA